MVQNLHVTDYGNNYIHISWTAPLTLNITNSDPDIWYSIRIAGLGDTLCSDCIETIYNITMEQPNVCQLYEFIVTPVNALGEGLETSVKGHFLSGKIKVLTQNFKKLQLPHSMHAEISNISNISLWNSLPYLEIFISVRNYERIIEIIVLAKCIFAFQPYNVYNVIMETLSDEGKMCIGTFSIERNLMVDLLLSAGTETGSDQLVFITAQNSCKVA